MLSVETLCKIAKAKPDVNQVCEPVAHYCLETASQLRQGDLFESLSKKTESGDIRVVELFAGVGGFRIGLERASKRYKTVWSNQWEPSTKRQDASAIYQARFGVEGHSNKDIATVPTEEIPVSDLLVGGFPCQDYSVATTLKNSGGIKGKKGILWWQIWRILHESSCPPPYLFLENVDRLLKSPAQQRGRDFAIILASLADLGYYAEWRVINAADYGMPQRRRRTYIVACHEQTDLAAEMRLTMSKDYIGWLYSHGLFAKAFPCQQVVGKTISKFKIAGKLDTVSQNFNSGEGNVSPFLDAGLMMNRQVWTAETIPVYNGVKITLGQILIADKDVPNDFFIDEKSLADWKYLKGPKSETRKTADGFEYHYSEGGMTFPDALDKPSRTVITGEGGKAPSRFKHVVKTSDGRYRRLTPIELERLNMFPDNHTFGTSDGRRAFLMGNALVTGVVERVGIVLEKWI